MLITIYGRPRSGKSNLLQKAVQSRPAYGSQLKSALMEKAAKGKALILSAHKVINA